MSIQSVGGAYNPSILAPRTQQQEGARETTRQGLIETPPGKEVARSQEHAQAAAFASELPAEAPPGTDPALWSVLTGEERRFFAQARAMGPVTYGKGDLGLAELGLNRGGRLDVRV